MTHTCIIPVFNTPGGHLIEAVNSMLYQKDAETNILIVDDGSTNEDTHEALRMLSEHPRVSVHYLPVNVGTPSALNIAHGIVKTEFSIVMGSDDIAHPNRLRLQLDYLKANPKTDVLGTGLWAFKDNGTLFRAKWFEFVHPEKPVPKMNGSHDKHFMVSP